MAEKGKRRNYAAPSTATSPAPLFCRQHDAFDNRVIFVGITRRRVVLTPPSYYSIINVSALLN